MTTKRLRMTLTSSFAFIIGWILSASTVTAAVDLVHPEEKVVTVEAEYLFVPQGFDDNDNAQVVLDGWLDNSCHKPHDVKVTKNDELNTIEVSAQAKLMTGAVCTQALERFTIVADLGMLPPGLYEVYTNPAVPTKALHIEEAASAGPDEQQYAHIEEVEVQFFPARKDESRWELVVKGVLGLTCQHLSEIQVEDGGDTIVVLPLIEERFEECQPSPRPFVQSVILPDYDDDGRYLAHVRGAKGQSINKVFSTQSYFP